MKKTMVAQITDKVGQQDPEVLGRILDINGEPTTMLGFLYSNLCDEGVDHISIGDAKEVAAMNVNETMHIGNSTIKRTK